MNGVGLRMALRSYLGKTIRISQWVQISIRTTHTLSDHNKNRSESTKASQSNNHILIPYVNKFAKDFIGPQCCYLNANFDDNSNFVIVAQTQVKFLKGPPTIMEANVMSNRVKCAFVIVRCSTLEKCYTTQNFTSNVRVVELTLLFDFP